MGRISKSRRTSTSRGGVIKKFRAIPVSNPHPSLYSTVLIHNINYNYFHNSKVQQEIQSIVCSLRGSVCGPTALIAPTYCLTWISAAEPRHLIPFLTSASQIQYTKIIIVYAMMGYKGLALNALFSQTFITPDLYSTALR